MSQISFKCPNYSEAANYDDDGEYPGCQEWCSLHALGFYCGDSYGKQLLLDLEDVLVNMADEILKLKGAKS